MVEVSSFDFARLAAIKQYADLEAELCRVMEYALQGDNQAAQAVFYGITNTRSKYAIIGNLLPFRAEGIYKKAWDKIERWLTPIDTARNHLVHWKEQSNIHIVADSFDPFRVRSAEYISTLNNPASLSAMSPRHYERDIWARRDDMRVALHIVNRFRLTLIDAPEYPWKDTFQQPIERQSPVQFLQRLNDKGFPAQLPPYDQTQLSRYRPDKHLPPEGVVTP